MTNVNDRLDAQDERIRELRIEMNELSERLIALDGEVARLQSVVERESPADEPAIRPAAPFATAPLDEVVVAEVEPVPAPVAAAAFQAPAAVQTAPAPEPVSPPVEPIMVEPERTAESEQPTIAAVQAEPVAEVAKPASVTPPLPDAQAELSRSAWAGRKLAHEAKAPEPVASEPVASEPVAQAPKPPRKDKASIDIEQRLGTNWLVWVGGIALALAGVYLVRYIAEQRWLTPEARCTIGVVAGLALIMAGEVIRRRPLERAIAAIRPDYVPQALTSGGLVTAFGSIYLAHAFYDLISPGVSFTILGGIAISAFLLSVVQGGFVALLGLVGATLTPALISTEDPSTLGFFSYLGVICLAAVAVTHRRHWYWLPELALVSMGGWSALWMVSAFAPADILPIGMTYGLVALAGLTLSMRPSPKPQQAELVSWIGLGLAALAAMTMANWSDIPVQAHWLILAYLAIAVLIARFLPRFDLALPVMAAVAIVTIGLNYIDARALDSLFERALGNPRPTLYFAEKYDRFITHSLLVGLLTFGGGLLALARAHRQTIVALATGAAPLLLVTVGYAEFGSDLNDPTWALAAVAVMALSAMAVLFLRRSLPGQIDLHSIYAVFAVASAFLALTIQFDRLWLTLSYAALTLAIALVSVRIDLPVLRRLVGLIVLVVLLRLTVNPDMRGYWLDYPLGMQWITYGLLVPLALFAATARIFKRAADDLTVSVLEGACLTLAVIFVSVEIRIWMTGDIYSGDYKLPEASLQTIAWLTSALVLAWRNRRFPRPFSTWGSRLLTIAGAAQAAALQLLRFNPILTTESVQGWGVFNILILSLLAPAILLWLLAELLPARTSAPAKKGGAATDILRAISAVLLFAFVTEEVRVLFQGEVIGLGHQGLIELYTTTLAWIVLGGVPFFMASTARSEAMRTVGGLILLVAIAATVLGHAFLYNPMLAYSEVRGIPVLNSLVLGFFLPALALYLLGMRMERPIASLAIGASYVLVFMGLWLEVKHGFQGARMWLPPENLQELYVTTLAWLGLAALPLTVARIGALRGANMAGHVVLGISVAMLLGGHAYLFNPALTVDYVRGYPILNDLQLGFVLPALILALLSRKTWPATRTWLQIAAYFLLFIGITLLVKHVFQGSNMHLSIDTASEKYAYSAVWLLLAIVTMGFGIYWQSTHGRYAALAVLILVVFKVFVIDTRELEGLWRVVSLFGLGISLVGIGWIYQRFVYTPRAKSRADAPPATSSKEA